MKVLFKSDEECKFGYGIKLDDKFYNIVVYNPYVYLLDKSVGEDNPVEVTDLDTKEARFKTYHYFEEDEDIIKKIIVKLNKLYNISIYYEEI